MVVRYRREGHDVVARDEGGVEVNRFPAPPGTGDGRLEKAPRHTLAAAPVPLGGRERRSAVHS
jgi:hypothetical protein